MGIKKITLLLWVLLCLALTPAGLDANDDDSGDRRPRETESGRLRLIYSPIAYYSPETDLAYGVAGSGIFRLSPKDGRNRPSSVSALAVHTQKNQFQLQLETDLYLNNLGARIRAKVSYLNYPDKFFGIGARTQTRDEEVFTSRSLGFCLSLEKLVWSSLSLGVRAQYDTWDVVETLAGGLLENGDYIGATGGIVAGIGLTATWDSRGRVYSPMSGALVTAQADFYTRSLGADYNFFRFILDARKYFSPIRGHVVAMQSRVELQSGEVPFNYLARFGGMYSMRGYYSGRFRDHNLLMAQVEYRMPLFKRVGLVGFAAAGTVAPTLGQLDLFRPLYSGGAGLRFVFDKKEHIVLRMDVGFGKDSSGIYFSIYEAF
ncbi:MAG: BamA/TamA family outer membrane protein [Acidobacteriota bacterium]|jgi:outer membrane protein assembly factor BamA|nr:BamA/TamA family outer membrane protein [Acidobacteriota bacterium]